MLVLAKTLKYACWMGFALYCYHVYLVFNKSKPEEGLGANALLLDYAFFTKFAYEDLVTLLTRPPVNSLLMERPPLPPGHQHMKTLVLNLTGTLVHSEYKASVTSLLNFILVWSWI